MPGATITLDYIEIDTDHWISAHAGDPIPELTEMLTDFDTAVHEATPLQLPTVELFITARAGTAWRQAEHATITSANGGGIVNLRDDLIIYRYDDPAHGPVALIATDDHGFTGHFTAYGDDLTDPTDWYDFHDVDIACPAGHHCSLHAGDLIDTDGTYRQPPDVFPDGQIVTIDTDPDSETHGDSRILCPVCSRHCTVDTPH